MPIKALLKKEKKEEEQEFEKLDDNYTWHSSRKFNINNSPYTYLRVKEVITGCGLAQCSGFADITDENFEHFKKTLDSVKKVYKRDGVGSIIATLGKAFYDREEYLLKLGFKLMSEYPNYRHGSDGEYTQRLYTITL